MMSEIKSKFNPHSYLRSIGFSEDRVGTSIIFTLARKIIEFEYGLTDNPKKSDYIYFRFNQAVDTSDLDLSTLNGFELAIDRWNELDKQ